MRDKIWGSSHRIEKYDFEEGSDYKFLPNLAKTSQLGGRPTIDYTITITIAKELSMVENNDLGKLSRKYFIAIEHAYLIRKEWNYDRADSLVCYSELQRAFMNPNNRHQLLKGLPDWANNNIQIADFAAINNAIIGMTAKLELEELIAYRQPFIDFLMKDCHMPLDGIKELIIKVKEKSIPTKAVCDRVRDIIVSGSYLIE